MKKGGNVGSGDPAGRKAIIRASLGLSATMRAQAARVRAEVRDIVRSRSLDPKVASRAREREGVYSEVAEKYRELARSWGYTFGKAVDRQSESVADATAKSMPRGATPKPLTAEQKIVALNGRTVDRMVAVATESMAENAVKSLRTAAVRVFARGAVEGLSDHEIQKALQEEWDKEAGNEESHRFRDKNGRSWSNASYLQMLTRTTLANVSRNTQISTLTQNGCDLARISDDGGGDSCDACSRWAGRIVSLTGATKGYPTLDEAEADGLFHPNCVHRIEYLDDDEIPEDAKKPDDEPEEDNDDETPPSGNPANSIGREPDFEAPRIEPSKQTERMMEMIGAKQKNGIDPFEANPDYFAGVAGADNNCPSAVAAFVARCMGYDVVAEPTPTDDYVSMHPDKLWMDAQKNRFTGRTAFEESVLLEKGAVYAIRYLKPSGDSCHVIAAVVGNGSVSYFDPQIHGMPDFSDESAKLQGEGSAKNKFWRVDNLSFSRLISGRLRAQ